MTTIADSRKRSTALPTQIIHDGTTGKVLSTAGGLYISYASAYDALNRMTIKSSQGNLLNVTLPDVVQTYTYTGTRLIAGSRVSNYEVAWASGNNQHTSLTMGYDYDYNGNNTEITQTEHTYSDHAGLDPIYPPISPNGLGGSPSNLPQTSYTVNYTYDEANQLTSATDSQTGLTYRYTYDASGNLRTMKTYLSSTATTPIHTKTLNYIDGILTGYTEDGVTTTFTTDDMGSTILMTRGGNTVAELTWGESRSLTGYETADFIAEYTYNADGLRIQVVFIGVNDSVVSLNGYTYCANSPVQKSDPSGYFYVRLSTILQYLSAILLCSPVLAVIISIGYVKLKALIVAKLVLLGSKLGSLWPVLKIAFAILAGVLGLTIGGAIVDALWDCWNCGYNGIEFTVAKNRWGIPYKISIYAH